MQFPLSFWDISLWPSVTAIILLATSELLSRTNKSNHREKKTKTAALLLGVLFMFAVLIRVYSML